MTFSPDLDQMLLISRSTPKAKKTRRDETIIEQLTHEIAILKRHKFAKRSEQISAAQGSLLDGLLNTELEAIEAESKALSSGTWADRTTPATQVGCMPMRAASSSPCMW